MHRRFIVLRSISSALLLFSFCSQAFAQGDPLVLQQQAIRRIDGVVEAFRKTGDFRSRLGELDRAEQELFTSNQMLESRRAWAPLALGLTKQGAIQRMRGNWPQALQLYKFSGEAAQRAGNVAYQADALAWSALAETSSGALGQALVDARQAVRLAETTNDKDVLARALDVLGSAQVAQRDLVGAADTINREVAVAKESKDPMTSYFAYFNRHDIYWQTAQRCDFQRTFDVCNQALDLARADLQQASSIARSQGFEGLARQTDSIIGDVETRRAMFKSTGRLDQNLQNAFQPKTPRDVLVSEAFVPPPEPVPPALLQLYQELKREEQRYGGLVDLGTARNQYVEGLLNEAQGNNDAALAYYMKGVERLERDRRALSDDRSRGAILENSIEFYYRPVLQMLQRHSYADAFELLERSRSRAMADMLASRDLGLTRPKEQQLYSQFVASRTRISASQSELFQLIAAPEDNRRKDRVAMLQREIRALENDNQKIVDRIATEVPHLQDLVVSQPATLKALQQSMREERYELLQYLVLDTGVVVWHIAPDSVYVRLVFLPRSELTRKVAALRASLADPKVTFDEKTARELFLFLVQPVLPRIRSERIVIVPQEDLNSIPFQVLQDPSNGRYFGERFQISYAPSATVLLALRRPPAISGGRLLAVGDPTITAAGSEVQAIAKLFPGRSKTVTDNLATESDVKNWIGEADIVHLSVHGKFDGADPLLSFLQLARGGGEDGKLSAAEMFGLPLDRSRLVVLSACESGRADVSHSNEINGMIRALLYAGAGRLVLSYWEVDSAATTLWMQTFYEAAQIKPLAEAARAALVKVKNTPAYSHPFYWAPFMLVGR